jgi:hypothetical protein
MIDMKWARDRMNGVKQQPVSNVEKASGTRNWKHVRRSNLLVLGLVVAVLSAVGTFWGVSKKELSIAVAP